MKVIAVIVLHNCEIRNSKTIESLKNALAYTKLDLRVIVWDNGINNQKLCINSDFIYIHSNTNVGVAMAYNYALDFAIDNNFNGLLLFDQDTSIPNTFFSDLQNEIVYSDFINQIAAIVPRIYCNEYCFSPSMVLMGGIHRPIPSNHIGIYPKEVFSINSGTLLNIDFLKKLGGFNELFWLDSLDRWLFKEIYNNNGKVFVSNSKVEHDLSILDYKNSVSISRYINIFKYESLFILNYSNTLNNILYKIRILIRAFKFLVTLKNKKYAEVTFRGLIFLLFKSKSEFFEFEKLEK
jgi:hypothetical protein